MDLSANSHNQRKQTFRLRRGRGKKPQPSNNNCSMKRLVSTAFPTIGTLPHKSIWFCHSKAALQKVICSKTARNRIGANAKCVKRSLFKANEWGLSSSSPSKGLAY